MNNRLVLDHIGMLKNLSRQGLLMGLSAIVALPIVIGVAFAADRLGIVEFASWFGHSFFIVFPWVVLSVIIFISVAILEDRRRRTG
jgi:hypothetical protein